MRAFSRLLTIALSALALPALPAPAMAQGDHDVATSSLGVAATAHPLATLAARQMLERGGNAADAAVAAGFAVAVTLPSMNSIGGRNQILVRRADGSIVGIDGATQVPAKYDLKTAPRASFGYATVATPGVVAGLIRLYREHATLPLDVVMAPAIEIAEHGFRFMLEEEDFQAPSASQLAQTAGARAKFLKADGTTYRAGELFVQADLARTLRQIAADSGRSFYHGAIADAIAKDMKANGGFVTKEDLDQYQAVDSKVVRGTYRGYELVGLDVPSAGVVTIQALQIMENFSRAAMSPEAWSLALARSIRVASRELARMGTDTAAARATSRAWAREQADAISMPRPPRTDTFDIEEGHYTTHVVVVDAKGMMVTLTQTVGPVLGSKVATPGLGFHYAATLGGYLQDAEAGQRTRSFISPFLVLKDGQPVLILGAAGGARIVAAVAEVVSRVIDDGMDLPTAMAAPRVFMLNDSTVEMETSRGGWTPEQVARMKSLGILVRESPQQGSFARVQAALRDPVTGEWTAVADPDHEGMAAGVEPPRRGRGGGPPPED